MTYRYEKLTGRSRHRSDEQGRLILQVEVKGDGRFPCPAHWRDAKTEDLTVKVTLPDCAFPDRYVVMA